MLITLSLVWFIFGFTAAIIWTTCKTISKHRDLPLSQWLSLLLDHLRSRSQLTELCDYDSWTSSQNILSPSRLLMSKDEVECTFEESSWQRLAYEDLKSTILGRDRHQKTFPCIYATKGYREDGHRYIFLKSSNPSEPQNVRLIGSALSEYLQISKSLGSNTSLVIIASPPEIDSGSAGTYGAKTVDDYNNQFWDMLRGLRVHDPAPWPTSIPSSTLSEKWAFCYAGEPIFPVLLTPAHSYRFSRHSSVPIIALQPKWVLDELLSTTEKREAATGKVRKLLREYDTVDVSPDLTGYGENGSQEVRQLCLKDVNESVQCPYENFDK